MDFNKLKVTSRTSKLRGTPRVLLILTFAFVVMFGEVKEARADPHAIFYTSIGQQQLFFNVLAALDQADYVEEAGQGAEGGTPRTREQLVGARGNAPGAVPPFSAEDSRLITSTKTNLSSVVTRPITLEGNDLYTDYLVRQLAQESFRRDQTNRLVFVLCEKAFGKGNCGDVYGTGVPGNPQQREIALDQSRKEAFITDSLAWLARPYVNGAIGALISGSDLSQEFRVGHVERAQESPSVEGEQIAYSLGMHNWRTHINQGRLANTRTRTGYDRQQHQNLIDLMSIDTLRSLVSTVDWGFQGRYPFDSVEFLNDGTIVVAPRETLKEAAADVQTNVFAATQVFDIANAAMERIAGQQTLKASGGVKATTEGKPWTGLIANRVPIPTRGFVTEVSDELKEPPASAEGVIKSLSGKTYSTSNITEFADPTSLERLGEDPVPSNPTSANTSTASPGDFTSTTTNPINAQNNRGAVRGTITDNRDLLSPQVNQRFVFQEDAHAYGVIQNLIHDEANKQDVLGITPLCGFTAC